MKKMLAIVLIVALALPLMMFNFVNAAVDTTWNGSILLNNGSLTFEAVPHKDGGKVYAPVAELVEKTGVAVSVDSLTDVKDVEGVVYVALADFAAKAGLYYYENRIMDRNYLMNNEVALADGVYKYTSTPAGNAADVAHTTITVEGGKIVAVTFDEQRGTGEWKFADGNYTTNWKNNERIATQFPGLDPDAVLAATLEAVVKNQTAYGMDADVYTGATSSYKKLATGTAAAMAAAKVATLQPEMPVYRDGKYVVVGMTDTRGYTPTVHMTIQNGRIVSVHYDDYNAEGVGKRETDYVANWASRFEGVDPEALISNAEAQLLRNQDANLVDTLTGATSWHKNFTKLVAGALDQAGRMDYVAGTEYKDGLYWVRGEVAGGYIPVLRLDVKDGEIAKVEYHEVNEKTNEANPTRLSKRHNPAYLERWASNARVVDLLAGRLPLDILLEMEATIVETQDINSIDAITGATGFKTKIQELTKAALVDANKEVIYVFVGDTAGSAYARQFLAIEKAGELEHIDYIEYHRGRYVPKMYSNDYVGPESGWVTRQAEALAGRAPLAILDEVMTKVFETKSVDGIDAITGATNWNSGIKLLAPKAFELIK